MLLAAAALSGLALPARAAAPDEERLLGSDREIEQMQGYLPFTRARGVSGVVSGSLAESTAAAGVSPAAMLEALKALATTVDLSREVHDSDRFYVRYEQAFTLEGAPIGIGRVLWIELRLASKRIVAVHRFRQRKGPDVFWTANGIATFISPIRLPVSTVVVSSGFGLRVDPMDQPALRGMGMGPLRGSSLPPALGSGSSLENTSTTYWIGRTPSSGMAMHEGVDLVAAPGTSIFAAADGVVKGAEPKGRYGNWIEIEHAGGIATVYGHLSGFAPGIRPGAQVRQSDVIGYVGTTGRTTGPHVHFELLMNGRPVNPIVHSAARRPHLVGPDLAAFRKVVAQDQAERQREDKKP